MKREARREYFAAHNPSRTWHWSQTFSGTAVIEIHLDCIPAPVGIMWIRLVGNSTVEILGVYVSSHLRRCGIGSGLIDYVIELWEPKKFITASATALGRHLLLSKGFGKLPNGDWEMTVKP